MSENAAPDCDVVIVGAGPTGLTLANLLALEGIRVLLVERNETTVQEPRAVSIDDESLRTMQAAGLLPEVMTEVVPGYGSRYLSPDGRCFLTVLPAGRPYGHPRRNAFRQPILERQLREGLARFAHVQTLFGWTMKGFTQDPHGVRLDIARQGETRTVTGAYLAACDGASSAVRKQLGIPLEGRTLPERWLIVDLENSPASERDTVVFCDAARPCIALPGPNLTRRFEFKLFAHEDKDALLRTDVVAGLLQSHGAAPQSTIVRKTVYTFHARVAKEWSRGRVFLAGDAAHLTPPFAGQGMNSGIRDAHNLAWKLAAALRGTLAPAILQTYETERRHHVGQMIALALTMGRIMAPPNALAGWLMQNAFRLAGLWPPVKAYFGEMKYKPKPRFEKGFLFGAGRAPVGCLLPQPTVRRSDGREGLFDDFLPRGFVLLGVNMAPEALNAAAQHDIWSHLRVFRAVLDPPPSQDVGDVARFYSGRDAIACARETILLVRPDRYVMAGFKPRDIDAVTRWLADFSNTPALPFPRGGTQKVRYGASAGNVPFLAALQKDHAQAKRIRS